MKKISLIVLLSVFVFTAFAQKSKFGHVDSNSIFSLMPEKVQAQKAVEEYAKSLEGQLQALNQELEQKYNDYMENGTNLSASIKQLKEEEIMNLQQRIQSFQVRAQQDLQNKENELLEPIYNKIKDAIKVVGEEKGLMYVFDKASLLYFSAESIDVTSDVKTKLNIK